MVAVPQRILIAGYMGFGNAGDEAIAEVMCGHLREQVPEAEITILSGDPERTAEAYGVRAVGWRDPLGIAEAVRTADLTLIGGGGLFQDYWGFDPDAVLTREHWGLSYYVAPALLAAIYGKPVMLYAVGVGPLFSEHGRRYTKAAAEIAARITVRDPASRDLLESAGVPGGKIKVTADPAFDLTPARDFNGFPEVSAWRSRKPAIAVSLRNWNIGTYQEFCERQIAAALDEGLASEDASVLFLPFQRGAGIDDDPAVANRVMAAMRRREHAAVLSADASPGELAGIIAQADLVLGMRLHSIIFSLAAKIPFVALEYDPKIGALAGLAGFEEYTLPFGGLDSGVLAERMRRALASREAFCHAATALVPALRSGARENAAIAAELLNGGSPAPEYSPATHEILGRIVTAQIAATERINERLRTAAAEAAALRAELGTERERLEAQAARLKEEWEQVSAQNAALAEEAARIRGENESLAAMRTALEQQNAGLARELGRIGARLEMEGQRAGRLANDLHNALAERGRTEERIAALLREKELLEMQAAAANVKKPGAIAKRGLQVFLDTLEICVPRPLRAAVRKYYLNWFYFRIYPERRA